MFFKVVFAAVLVALLPTSGEGLQCYVCTSENHTACEDPFVTKRAKEAGFITTCPEPVEPEQKVLCRKYRQTVLGDLRVVRSCGFKNDTKPCYSTRNKEVVVESCQCFDDLCNSSVVNQLAPLVLLVAAAIGLMPAARH